MTNLSNRRILIVDDNEAIHRDFQKLLSGNRGTSDLAAAAASLFGDEQPTAAIDDGFELDSAFQGQEALVRVTDACQASRHYALAFVDVRMPPGWDGIETIARLWQVDPNLQVCICTAHSDRSWEETVQVLGRTDQFLVLKKPFDNIEVRQLAVALTEKWALAQQARRHVRQLELVVQERTREVVATRDLSVFALAKLAESRDIETGEHLERIRGYSQLLARHLQEHGPYRAQITRQFLEDLYRSSPLHDIGKVGIPDAVLLKPGKLTPDEFEVMKRHTTIGAETLDSALRQTGYAGFLSMAADIARYHHERFDGTGYPLGLHGQAIPLAARIVALADVYDALTSRRVYKPAYDAELAREMVEAECGRHFDPVVVDAFTATYPGFLRLQERQSLQQGVMAPVGAT